MSEFTKVSVHYHCGNEPKKRNADYTLDVSDIKTINFNYEIAQSEIEEAISEGYGIFTITNSNKIHYQDIARLKEEFKDRICILSGVEINLKHQSKDKYLHIVVVLGDDEVKIRDKSIMLDSFTNENKSAYLTLSQFLNFVGDESHKCIIAAHGLKQDTRSCLENPETFSEIISLDNMIPIIIEDNKKFHKKQLEIRMKNEYLVNIKEQQWLSKASSISSIDRTRISGSTNFSFIWGDRSFDDLFFASLMGGDRILSQDDIVPKNKYISRILFNKTADNQIESGSIELSHGLNTIVGPSGSGKTLLLEIISQKLRNQSLNNKSISRKTDYKDVYSGKDIFFEDENGNTITSDDYQIYEGKNLYNEIISSYSQNQDELLSRFNIDINTSNLVTYIQRYFGELNRIIKNKRRANEAKVEIDGYLINLKDSFNYLNINKPNSSHINIIIDNKNKNLCDDISLKIEEIELDKLSLNFQKKELLKIATKYDFERYLIDEIENLFTKLLNKLEEKSQTLILQKHGLELKVSIESKMRLIVEEYNGALGRKTSEYYEQQKFYNENINSVITNFKETKVLESDRIPLLSAKKIAELVTISNHSYFQLEKKGKTEIDLENIFESLSVIFGNTPKITKGTMSKAFSKGHIDFSSYNDVSTFINTLVNHSNSLELMHNGAHNGIVDYVVKIKNLEGGFEPIEKVTAGNLSKIYINYLFENEIRFKGTSVIVVYDQPEANMEKKFIHDILSEKLKDLRMRCQVIIATHEPLLVVNSDANKIILSSNNKTISEVNNISYSNVSFVGLESQSEMIKKLANLIDGSTKAIKKRNKIYGGLINE